MKRIKAFIFLSILSILSSGVFAQDNFFGITYNTAITTGETHDFIDSYSWGLMGLEWKKMMNDNVSVGINLAWQIMSQKVENASIDIPETNITISGTQVRYLNYIPINVTTSYHFNPQGKVIPFVGAGAGLYSVMQRIDVSGFVTDNNTWNFGVYPEVGFLIPTGGAADLFINSKYHYMFETSNGPSHSYLNINVGFSYFY